MNDKLHGITTFVQVVDAGSFTLAAERMNLTRSAVGKVISRLEARLGVRLLPPPTRSQTPTQAGQGHYQPCGPGPAGLGAAGAAPPRQHHPPPPRPPGP